MAFHAIETVEAGKVPDGHCLVSRPPAAQVRGNSVGEFDQQTIAGGVMTRYLHGTGLAFGSRAVARSPYARPSFYTYPRSNAVPRVL